MTQAERVAQAEKYDATAIKVLGGIEAVRKRPAMYIGDVSTRGLHHLVEEVVMNSVDEAVVGFCGKIGVKIGADGSVSVTDDGRGIPVDNRVETGKPARLSVRRVRTHRAKAGHTLRRPEGDRSWVGVSVVN